jgi:hypothetical protein
VIGAVIGVGIDPDPESGFGAVRPSACGRMESRIETSSSSSSSSSNREIEDEDDDEDDFFQLTLSFTVPCDHDV